ncbi:MAG: 5'-deoxynucleotidase [Lachnospiraceae bacterium]|nr:5'-deoxynucleotidase [Lachnospiraceae bacterium]
MNNSNFFAILSRMKYVNRWGLMRNARNESLSDHTLDVVFIAHALVVIANTYYYAALDEGRVALLAAFHDAPEIITGDLPTPVKYFDPEIKRSYDRVEQSAKARMISQLPEEMQMTYDGIMNGEESEDDILMKYVKAADKLSALIKCIEEEQSGNKDFAKAKEATLKTIQDLQMPEVDFFLDYFLPGYYLTLDEQTENGDRI